MDYGALHFGQDARDLHARRASAHDGYRHQGLAFGFVGLANGLFQP